MVATIYGKNCLFRYVKLGDTCICKVLKQVPNSKVMKLIRTEEISQERFNQALAHSKKH